MKRFFSIFCIILLSLPMSVHAKSDPNWYFVRVKEAVNVRYGPGVEYEKARVAYPGEELLCCIKKDCTGWASYPAGQFGDQYLCAKYVEIIPDEELKGTNIRDGVKIK